MNPIQRVNVSQIISNEEVNPLSSLLDNASTKEIQAVLTGADPINVSSLTTVQMLRLSSILNAEFPAIIQRFMDIIQNPKDLAEDFRAIQNLEGLTEEEKDAALAYYIERSQTALNEVKGKLSDEEFLRLAPYLRYVDFRGFYDIYQAREFLANCTNLNILLTESPYKEYFGGTIIEGLKELPFCHTLQCSGFFSLSALPALPLCERLICKGGLFLSALPALPLCRQLDCSVCPLTELPALPLCQDLNCSDCPFLKELPALPHCQKLECNNSLFTELPALPRCQELSCWGNPNLKKIPALPLGKELNCYGCDALEELPSLPLCQNLNCSSCPALKELPALPQCQKLNCNGCAILQELPALPLCQTLNCSWCRSLKELPTLPLCQTLYCQDCSTLTTLSALPLCQTLNCHGCPLTELPEVPWNAHVVTEGVPFNTLDIPIEKFKSEPVSLCLQLGDHLLQNMPFPNIYYFENGQRNQAIDFGGVRRDFVTRLCLNLFNENGLKREDNFPIADNEERAYRSLGCLLAQCFPANSAYKTGPLFDPKVYQCIFKPNPTSDEWFLSNYLDLINAPAEARQLIDLSQEAPDLTSLAYFIDPTGENAAQQSREAQRQSLLLRAKVHPQLKAISWMAQEMRKRVNITGNLQERIEGVLNPAALKRKLTWEFTNPRYIKTQEYLMNWIDRHEDLLEKFVYAVTGIRTLCANDIKIQVFDRGENYIPVAHTCYFSLELSANYASQEAFDQKMDYFLENALAGSGFTLA